MKYQDLLELGFHYESKQNFDEALDVFTKAIDLDPDRPEAWMCKGGLLLEVLKRYEDSLECLDKVISLKPSFIIDALVFKGLALFYLERDEEAQKVLVEATEQTPHEEDARGLFHQARAYAILQNIDAVIDNLKAAFELNQEFYRLEDAMTDDIFSALFTEEEFEELFK